MSFSLHNKKVQILFLSLICTAIIFFINKNPNTFSSKNLPFNLRNLFSKEDVDQRCSKTHKNFLDKYTDPNSINIKEEDKPLDKYQQALIDIIVDQKYSKFKEYLLRIIIYVIAAILDVILIIIWFVFCGCCCCSKKDKLLSSGYTKCFFLLFFLLSFIVILACVLSYFLIPCFYKSINGVVCSLYKLVFHFIEGTKNDFPQSNWKGFEGIESLIVKYTDMKTDSNKLPSIECNKYDNDEEKTLCESYSDYKSSLNNNENEGFMNHLKETKNEIKTISNSFTDIRDKTLGNIEEIMGYVDKYCKLGLLLMFSAIVGFCLLCLISLTLFYVCNCNCIKCLYHLFWNIEMLLIIVTILIGIVLGILGIVCKDAVSILKYTKSMENLNSTNPIILDNIENDSKQYIDSCFNGDGDLSNLFTSENVFDESIKENFENLDKYYSGNKQSLQKYEELGNAFESLYNVMKKYKELYDDLNKNNLKNIFDCNFIKYDFGIVTEQLNNNIAKNLVLLSIIIIGADLIEMFAILFGIIVASKYRGAELEADENQGRVIRVNPSHYGQNMDVSSDNLRHKIK